MGRGGEGGGGQEQRWTEGQQQQQWTRGAAAAPAPATEATSKHSPNIHASSLHCQGGCLQGMSLIVSLWHTAHAFIA
jgi:hypothetical protein